jgi:hypothetical protein
VLTGVEQGKTSLQIFQTDSAAGAILVCFDPMSGIADFHLELGKDLREIQEYEQTRQTAEALSDALE